MVDFVRVEWPFVRTILPSAAIRVGLVGECRQVASGRHRAASGDRKIEHGVLGEADFVAVQGGEPVSNDCGCPVKMMSALACWISLARIFRHDQVIFLNPGSSDSADERPKLLAVRQRGDALP